MCRCVALATGGLFVSSMIGCGDNVSDKSIEFVPMAEVRNKLNSGKPEAMVLVDPRGTAEYASGRLPGAMSLQLSEVAEEKDSLDPRLARYKQIVVYGNDPGSAVARAMTKRLIRSGAKNVRFYSGGVAEWTGAGLELERDPVAKPAKDSGAAKPMTP